MPTHEQWRGNTGGTAWMHSVLIHIFRHIDIRCVYVFMALFVIPFYMVFAHKGYLAIYHYFRRRQGYGVWKSLRYTYLNHYRFGQIILDRFAVYAGQHFHFDIDGNEDFLKLSEGESGFVILSSHVGNYELAGYTFRSTGKNYNAVVFSGESADVMENRNRVLTKNNIHMIPVSEDMSHVFAINNALASGEIVSIPGDRIFGSPRVLDCSLLGGSVSLPLGPYAIATQRGVPVIAIFVMKESAYRYQVYVRRLKLGEKELHRHEKAQALANQFAENLEWIMSKYPEQWFNYFEYWHE